MNDDLTNSGMVRNKERSNKCQYPARNIIYGASISDYNEPVDQVAIFLLVKRLHEIAGNEGFMLPYVAGRISFLNSTTVNEINTNLETTLRKQEKKKKLYEKFLRHFGINGKTVTSDEVWSEKRFWQIVAELANQKPEFALDSSRSDRSSLKFGELPEKVLIFADQNVLRKIGNVDAKSTYPMIEIAEMKFLQEKYEIGTKIGPMTERSYDDHIKEFMDVVHLSQPVDLKTYSGRVKTLSPYIARKNQFRVYFEDETAESIMKKLEAAENFCANDSPQYYDEITKSVVFNPIVQYSIHAVETARAIGKTPLIIGNHRMHKGTDVIKAAEKGVRGWHKDTAKHLWELVVEPLKDF